MSRFGKFFYGMSASLFFGLLFWLVRPVPQIEEANLSVLIRVPFDITRSREDLNTDYESRRYQLKLTADQAYTRVRGELLSRGWVEGDAHPVRKRVGGEKMVIGYSRRFEKISPARNSYIDIIPLYKPTARGKSELFLTAINHRVPEFWNRL